MVPLSNAATAWVETGRRFTEVHKALLDPLFPKQQQPVDATVLLNILTNLLSVVAVSVFFLLYLTPIWD